MNFCPESLGIAPPVHRQLILSYPLYQSLYLTITGKQATLAGVVTVWTLRSYFDGG